MDHKNPINGLDLTNLLVIGKIIKKMALEFSIIRMGISMRADGRRTRGTVKAHFGLLIQKISWGESIQVIGRTIQSKEEERCFIRAGIVMMVCGWTIFPMEKEGWFTLMAMSMKECGIWERGVAMVYWPRDVVIISKVIGSMIKGKGKAPISFVRRIRYLLESGLMMLPKQGFTLRFKIQLQSKSREKNISQTTTFFRLSSRSAWRTQLVSWSNQSKKYERIEPFIAPSISLWMNYILVLNCFNFKKISTWQYQRKKP